MGRIVIVVYRPKKRQEETLLRVIKDHMPVLESQGLITNRKPIVMRAKDQSIVEVFEWKSEKSIEEAHTNPEVLKLWDRFNDVCNYEAPVNVNEFHNLFSDFEPIN